ncbi:MAG: hypothetical protein ACJA1R_003252, partial [Flavobacteriales bacterium]
DPTDGRVIDAQRLPQTVPDGLWQAFARCPEYV